MRSGCSYLCLRADYIPSFVAIFHEYISFCGLSIFLKQIISKQIKRIDNLLIFSFSLSKQSGFELNFGSKYVFKWVDTRIKNLL